ncbi:MAG: Gfo/Idh/MocA family protein [Pirellulaceae bacterium]
MNQAVNRTKLRVGMVGMGMIFDETYRPFLENAYQHGIYDSRVGVIDIELTAVASRTGRRAEAYRESAGDQINSFESFIEPGSIGGLLDNDVDFVCVATPDDRHFDAVMEALNADKHVLVEKPSVLSMQQLDEIEALACEKQRLCKVVYHKLFDPDHKKLRTLVADDVLQHVNTGYCSLLEPKQISGAQFSEWIQGRNPGTYVAVHYIKLIDFTFGGRLTSVSCTGQRGLVGAPDGNTWDSVQLRLIYQYDSGREAAFDIHTSWVTPDNFPGYVEQEVQFRFDNGLWNGHSRKRGVECTVEGRTPMDMKISMNNHYNGTFVEPSGLRSQRGYGIEVLEQFAREVAFVESGDDESRQDRLTQMQALSYNDISADRQTVAAVHAMEAILEKHAQGKSDCVVKVNTDDGGLVLYEPGSSDGSVLYNGKV